MGLALAEQAARRGAEVTAGGGQRGASRAARRSPRRRRDDRASWRERCETSSRAATSCSWRRRSPTSARLAWRPARSPARHRGPGRPHREDGGRPRGRRGRAPRRPDRDRVRGRAWGGVDRAGPGKARAQGTGRDRLQRRIPHGHRLRRGEQRGRDPRPGWRAPGGAGTQTEVADAILDRVEAFGGGQGSEG